MEELNILLQGVLQLGNTKTLNEGTEYIATGCAAARQYQNF